jgi:hypothetical protein
MIAFAGALRLAAGLGGVSGDHVIAVRPRWALDAI